MGKRTLFDDSEGSDKEVQFNTNEDYAKSYNNFRQKELLKKYKDRGLDVDESDFDSDTESSDNDDAFVDTKFDQEFFKTLSSLKSKDPTIYDKNKRFFEGYEFNDKDKDKSSKPVTLKSYETKLLLETGGKIEDSDSENEDNTKRAASPTFVEEERKLKAEFKKVLNEASDSSDEEFGGIFTKRIKSKEEKVKEEEDFTAWLAGQKDNVEDEVKTALAPLKNYWSSSKLSSSERFLRDYILNKGYSSGTSNSIPTYEEIVEETTNLSADEQELEKQEDFEHKYNFRFEEPDSEFVKRYPRTIEQSVRKQDNRRKEKRQEVKERKEREKRIKMQEVEMVKAMKRKEIQEKIKKLKEVTGNDQLGFRDEELESDFDPDAHDKRMDELFNEDYYGVDEGEEKPECPDFDELKIEDWDNYDPNADGYEEDDYEPHCEDDDFNMDCDYDPNSKVELQKELIENTRRKGKRKRRNPFVEMIKAKKPVFDPNDEKTYSEYMDEYYKLDCEDVIGDIHCRFKYTETTPNDFGLTVEEILLAKNKELNQWASLKKAVQIRPENIEKKEQRLYKLKAKNDFLKRKIFKSLYGEGSDEDEETEPAAKKEKKEEHEEVGSPKAVDKETSVIEANNKTTPNESVSTTSDKKKSRKKNRNKKKKNTTQAVGESAEVPKSKEQKVAFNAFRQKKPHGTNAHHLPSNKKNFAKRKGAKKEEASTAISDDRLQAYGINPKKFHKKQKYNKSTA